MSLNKLKHFLKIDKNANKEEKAAIKEQVDKAFNLETTNSSSLGYIPVIPINRELNTTKFTTLEAPIKPTNVENVTQSATLENTTNNTEEINKKEEKRQKWNAYMREYMAKRRKEQKEREDKILIVFNKEAAYYKNEDIKNVLFSYINLFIEILNSNSDKVPKEILEEINNSVNSNNFIAYAISVEEAVKTLLM